MRKNENTQVGGEKNERGERLEGDFFTGIPVTRESTSNAWLYLLRGSLFKPHTYGKRKKSSELCMLCFYKYIL